MLDRLDDHYNQTPYRYERDTPAYYAAPFRFIFNNKAYQAHIFREPEFKRIMNVK